MKHKMARKPNDLMLQFDGMCKNTFTFTTWDYGENKGADGRIHVKLERGLQEGHFGDDMHLKPDAPKRRVRWPGEQRPVPQRGTVRFLPPENAQPALTSSWGNRRIILQAGDMIRLTRSEAWYNIKILEVSSREICRMRIEAVDSKNPEKRVADTTAQEFVKNIQPLIEHSIVKVYRNGEEVFACHPY